MKEFFIKKTALGTMHGEVKEFKDGTVAIYTAIGHAHIYQGNVSNIDEAWAWFINRGYTDLLA